MYRHLILIGSDYYSGLRIGFHFNYELNFQNDYKSSKFNKMVKTISESNIEGATFAIHDITTFDKSWESVVDYDPFFKGVSLEKSAYAFIHKLSSEKSLKAIDIAQLILLTVSCTPLKLQKLLYLVYSDYLVETGIKMFEEKFVAYKYGPVVEEVYSDYRGNSIDITSILEKDKLLNLSSEMDNIDETSMIIAKVTGSRNGFSIYESCMKTLEIYGGLSAYELVDLTHKKKGPWDRVYEESSSNLIITDELIIEHH